MSKTTLIYVGLFLAGVVLAGRVRALPLGNKIPTL
jgi:hypothetical protein